MCVGFKTTDKRVTMGWVEETCSRKLNILLNFARRAAVPGYYEAVEVFTSARNKH